MERERTIPELRYNRYKRCAKERNLEFVLTIGECTIIFRQPCHYCGIHAPNGYLGGIDRVDNDQGYLPDNVVPCCSECNFAKHVYSKDQFLTKMAQIYAHQKFE